MPEKVKPFLALHYSPGLLKSINKLVCPPYDVISAEEEAFLRRSSPYNFCHILLKEENSSYKDLGKKFRTWLEEGILVEEKEPCFYLTLQEFRFGKRFFKRLGFLGLLKLDESLIFPHERTHSKPKKDRYQVIKHTQANLSPIFVVYPKRKNEPLSSIFKGLKDKQPFLKLKDKGVSYRIWKISEESQIRKIQDYFKNAPFFIADGHHRFEVALNFFKKNKDRAYKFRDLNYILAYFSPQDKNLLILPTHRILKKEIDKEFLINSLSPYFAYQGLSSLKDLSRFLNNSKIFSFGFIKKGVILYFSLKDKSLLNKVLPEESFNLYKNLDVFLLHNWVFKDILNIHPEETDILYTKDIYEARRLTQQERNSAFLLRPPDLETVMKIAFLGRILPQKTTYFYPKFLSGLILRKLY